MASSGQNQTVREHNDLDNDAYNLTLPKDVAHNYIAQMLPELSQIAHAADLAEVGDMLDIIIVAMLRQNGTTST